MSETAYTYLPDKNPGTEAHPASLPGAPLGDISQAQLEQLPRHIRRDVAASPMYRASKAGKDIETADQAAIEKEAKAAEKAAAGPVDETAPVSASAKTDKKEAS